MASSLNKDVYKHLSVTRTFSLCHERRLPRMKRKLLFYLQTCINLFHPINRRVTKH